MLSYPLFFVMCPRFLLHCMNFTHHDLCMFVVYLSSSLDSLIWGGRKILCLSNITKIYQGNDMYCNEININSCHYMLAVIQSIFFAFLYFDVVMSDV